VPVSRVRWAEVTGWMGGVTMNGPLWRGFAGRLRYAAAAAAIVAVTAAGPASAQRSAAATAGWPQFQGNASHTGFEPGEQSITKTNVGQLTVAWTAALPGVSDNSEVAVSGGVAFAGAGDTLTAFDAANGTPVWQASLPGVVLGTPSVQGGLVLVGIDRAVKRTTNGFVVALNASTGATVWKKPVGKLPGGDITSSTSVTTTPNYAYVTLSSGRVDELGIRHGYLFWQSAVLPGCVVSQPSVAGGLVVVGGGGGYLSALHASDGTLAWQDTLESGGCGQSAANWLPAISQGTVYAGLLNAVAAVSLSSGAVKWQNDSVTSVFFPLSVTAATVIASPVTVGANENLVALSRSSGSVVWQTTVSGEIAGTATFGGLAWANFAPGSDGNYQAVAFGRFNGHQYFSSASYPDDTQGLPPVVAAGHVYVNLGSQLVCLALPASS
jgi:outer membrane protein assembly factor BamB